MCKELTVVWIFSLGVLADFLWFQNTATFSFIFYLQFALALFLLAFIVLAGRKYLARRFRLFPKFSLALAWKHFQLGFRLGQEARQTLWPKA